MRDDPIEGSNDADVLRGTDGDDVIVGRRGDDQLRGRAGDDTLQGGRGDDTLIGGGGRDVADYSDLFVSRSGVRLDLGDLDPKGFAVALVDEDGDGVFEERDRVLGSNGSGRGVEGFLGSDGRDVFVGDEADNLVLASDGADFLVGGAGFDTADYSAIGVRLIPEFLDEALGFGFVTSSFAGRFDTIAGFERVVGPGGAIGRPGDQVQTATVPALDVDLGAERASFVVEPGTASEESVAIEVVGFRDVIGSGRDDVIVGDGQDNEVAGSLGDDVLRGAGGLDTLTYAGSGAAVTIGLGGTNRLFADGELAGTDTVGAVDFEAGTAEVFEVVIGDGEFASRNTIDASVDLPGAAAVRIDLGGGGRSGSDLRAGRVDVVFEEDAGGFSAGGGYGFDVVGFGRAVGTSSDDVIRGDGGANRLKGRRGDDRLDGKGGDDDLRGGGGADRLDGRRGDDTLHGGSGDDRLFGQGGDDVIRGGRGSDELGGGGGEDTFRFTGSDIAADAGRDVDVVIDFEAQDAVLLAGRRFSAEAAFDLALEEAVIGGVGFALNGGGDQIVLRADGRDADAVIAASEVFARLRIDADDFLS